MRGGPGLGNISGAQGDYFQATKGGGHGDYHMIVLAPASVQEMFDHTYDAFSLADKYRIPVMVLSDGYLGQMLEPLEFDEDIRPSGIVDKPWALTGARGRSAQSIKSLYLGENALEGLNIKLQGKYRDIESSEVRAEEYRTGDADIVLVAFGTPGRIARACVDDLREEGIKAGLLRPVTLWPFPSARIAALSQKGCGFFVIEMNSGQMLEDVKLASGCGERTGFYGRMAGAVPDQVDIVKAVRGFLRKSG
jgi:2-oxoglutarate ferredoxin oxidoreductase subunit alpha